MVQFAYRHTGYGDWNLFAWHKRTGAGGDRDVWSTRHTFESLGFYKKYGPSHPEYFVVGEDGRAGTSVALAHPGVVEAAIAEAQDYFRKQKLPGRRYFLVIPADGRGCCHCPLCQGKLDASRGPDGDLSDYVAEAAVKVAEGMGSGFPDAHIVYCAYTRHKLAPKHVAKLPPNMVVLIAQSRCRFYDERERRAAYDLVRAWQALGPQAIYFCRYDSQFVKMTPSPAPHLISDDLKALKRLSDAGPVKLCGEMNFCGVPAESPYSWWHHLNAYVTARLLWNPDLDVDALLDDYCARFYGPAAGLMRRFIDRCEELYHDDAQRDLYSVATIDALDAMLQAALRQTEGTVYGRRVAFVSGGFDLVRRMRRKLASVQDSSACDLETGLALHLPFDEGRGTTAHDAARGSSASIGNAAWTEGRVGGALEFSGDRSGVRMPALSLADTDYTIAAWIRPSAITFTGEQFIVGPDMWNRQCLKIENASLCLFHRSPQNRRLAAPPREFTDGTWVHVAATFSRTNGMAVYLDGRLVALDMEAIEPSKYPITWIGASGRGATRDRDDQTGCFQGAIDEVRVYTRELSYREIQRLATAGK